AGRADTDVHSSLGRTVARTTPCAAPEVVGRPKGQVWVGPHSDVYSLGRLCLFGLTGRPDPDTADRLLLPEAWQKLLADCTAWTMNRRPAHVGLVLDRLAQAPGADGLINRIERDLHETTVAGLTAAIEADPDNLSAYLHRAGAYFRQGDFERAIADFTAVLQKKPGDA